MQDFGTKTDDTAGPSGQLSAAEFNNLATENENAVLRSGLALSGSSETQLAQSLFLHGVKSESFQDNGSANIYVATPVSGAGGVALPAAYTSLDGSIISFKASNANTGASTLNIGQTTGTLLGAKPIRTQSDEALAANSILTGQRVQVLYNAALNGGGGAWELLPWSINGGRLLGGPQVFSSVGAFTYTPTQGMSFAIIEVQGGGGAGAGSTVPGAGNVSIGAGGNSGAYAKGRFTAASIGVSQTVTVGAAGAPAAGASGGNGGTSSVGTLISSPGGNGGPAGNNATPPTAVGNGALGAAPSGANIFGSAGFNPPLALALGGTSAFSGAGAPSLFGSGGNVVSSGTDGIAGNGAGSGGGGSASIPTGAIQTGGAGKAGIVIIWEYA